MASIEEMANQIVNDIKAEMTQLKSEKLRAAGSFMVARLKQGYLQQEMFGPPLSPATVKRKGGDTRKLIDTGAMMNSIDYVVENGVLSVGSDYMADQIGKPLVEIHEDGVAGKSGWKIPPRPLLKHIITMAEPDVDRILSK